ncbi:tubby C-terminal-like domain-containing protein [Daldinia sp. FL1419]|nr:tubby C-terminal-like domain-containing protein [Daldinia sp. FL1419]
MNQLLVNTSMTTPIAGQCTTYKCHGPSHANSVHQFSSQKSNKMETQLQTPSPPVNVFKDYVSTQHTTLNIYCHDRIFKRVTVTDSTGQTLFRVEGTSFGTSWSWRRKVLDGSDNHIFDFRHKSIDIKNGWIIENPDGDKLCSLVHKSQLTHSHSAVDATVRTQFGEEVLVIMRPNDHAALNATISVDDKAIATIRKVEDNDLARLGTRDRTVWEVQVASGVDLSLILILALCRAEMAHVWRQ